MLLDIVLWILFGALAGWIASMIMKTDGQMGALANIVVGIIGSFIGGFVYRMLTGDAVGGFNFLNLVIAIVGAVIFLAIVKVFTGSRAQHVQ